MIDIPSDSGRGFKSSLHSRPKIQTQDVVISIKSSPPRSKGHSIDHDCRSTTLGRRQSVSSVWLSPRQYTQKNRTTHFQQSVAPLMPQVPFPTTDDYMMYWSNTEPVIPEGTSPSPSFPRKRIEFYDKNELFYGFTNFSPHAVSYLGKDYPTSEHLFQSLKFTHRPNLAEHIRTCDPRPIKALSEARRFQAEVRSDWKNVNLGVMDLAIWYKFDQHPELKAQLLSTGDAELVEKSDIDYFWGVGKHGSGRNELGKALERLRTQLRVM